VVAIPVARTCRIAAKRLTLTGGAYRVGDWLPGTADTAHSQAIRRQTATSPVATPRSWATTPVNTTRPNRGPA